MELDEEINKMLVDRPGMFIHTKLDVERWAQEATRLKSQNAELSQAVNDKDQELFESQELAAELLEALEAVAVLIEDANKSAPNYRLKMCIAAETALPYLQEAIRKASR